MKKKVFVMEDNPDILENVVTALRHRGFEVSTRDKGEGTMDQILNYRPDVVILDIMVPKPNGLQICYMLKANEQTKDIPVILISAKTQDLDLKLGYRMGANRYLTKPFHSQELLDAVNSFVKA